MNVKKEWLEWLASDDTGISSRTMFSAITGVPVNGCDVPGDIADVGRCIRMLKKLPELRPQIGKVIEKHIEWTPYIDSWKYLESQYEICVKWEALPKSEQDKLKKKEHFVVPNDEFWNTMQELECASRYLKGWRIQGYPNSWRNKAPVNY